MTCEELRDGYDIYALGADDEPESSQIREHLRRDCPNCVPAIRDSYALVAQMSLLTKEAAPPARLRNRVIAAVNPTLLDEKPRRSHFGWNLVLGAAAAFLLATAAVLGFQVRDLSEIRRADAARLKEALTVLSAPDSLDVSFGAIRAVPPRGRVVVNRHHGVVLIASNLPQVAADRAFELWLIPKGGKPIPSGMFRAELDGTGFAIQRGEIPENLATVAVTVEDELGASAPTTKPIIAAATAATGA